MKARDNLQSAICWLQSADQCGSIKARRLIWPLIGIHGTVKTDDHNIRCVIINIDGVCTMQPYAFAFTPMQSQL